MNIEAEIKTAIRQQIIPSLQHIQNFHDGLPSAIYASQLLRSLQTLSQEFADSAYGKVLQALDQSLSTGQQWSCYTMEYYQTATRLLSELIDRPQITTDDVQSAIQTIGQISATMTQPGIVTVLEPRQQCFATREITTTNPRYSD